jgi:SAM-dependent methyltransferase
MSGPVTERERVERAKDTWDGFDFDLNWQVSWRNIPEILRSTRPYPDNATLQSMIDGTLMAAFPAERLQLHAAALLCGDFRHERQIFRDRYRTIRFARVDGYDLSPVNLDSIKGLDLEFVPHAIDCNNLVMERNSLHFIVAHDGIHHVYNIGNLMFQSNQALRDGGLMYVEEYIGPRFLQIPPSNYWISRLLLTCLFSRRERTNHEGTLKGKWIYYPPGTLDPSEACNSEIIERELLHYFEPLHILRFGGLCYPVFEGLGLNFKGPSWRFKFIIYLERALQHLGIIKPLFLQAVLRKKKVW